MSEEHIKLVAKIQHFYGVMLQRFLDFQERGISAVNDSERMKCREKCADLNVLIDEYARTFKDLLYREPL